MAGFFVVGERYQNRLGEYEVLEVRSPVLVIRYSETGRIQEVDEELQERIVRNLRREIERASRPPEARKPRARVQVSRRKKATFDGFSVTDFQGRVKGTTWRSKTSFGGVLAQLLTAVAGEPFDSWVPNRLSSCFVARPEECSQEHLADTAQFFARASTEGLTYGLQVQRPAEAGEGTCWDQLLNALTDDEDCASALFDLLSTGEAELVWYAEATGVEGAETVRAEEDGLVTDRGAVTEEDNIEDLIERLKDAPTDQSLTLSIETTLSVEDAVAAGPDIGDRVVSLFERLLVLYRACGI